MWLYSLPHCEWLFSALLVPPTRFILSCFGQIICSSQIIAFMTEELNGSPAETAPTLMAEAEREEWRRLLRLQFSKKEMLEPDGKLRKE